MRTGLGKVLSLVMFSASYSDTNFVSATIF
jgi:hypothetical protein